MGWGRPHHPPQRPEHYSFQQPLIPRTRLPGRYDLVERYSSSRTGGNPAAFLEHFFQESSDSAVTLIRYFLVLLRLRV